MPLKKFLPLERAPGLAAPKAKRRLPPRAFGCLTAEYRSASHHPIKGNKYNPRHIYLTVQVPKKGKPAGIFEAAVNIRSDQGTEVLFAERIEDVSGQKRPAYGFRAGVHLAYGNGQKRDTTYMGLANGDFQSIQNDALYSRIAQLCQDADQISVYGVTYDTGDGIHDVHMNSGTAPSDPHHASDRDRQDGAIAFYVTAKNGTEVQALAHWIFIRFASQSVVGG